MRAANVDTSQKPIVPRGAQTLECVVCGEMYRRKNSLLRLKGSSYCSRGCMQIGYAARMAGAKNPNFRDRPAFTCARCGSEFSSYAKGRKYCSQPCSHAANLESLRAQAHRAACSPKPKARRGNREHGKCEVCGAAVYRRKTRSCGIACANELRRLRWMEVGMRYGARKDQNHKEIVDALKDCGSSVYDLSAMGMGVPDCVVWASNQWNLVEIKNPKNTYGRRGLNRNQQKWLSQWRGGPVYVLRSVAEAIQFAKGDFRAIEVVTPDLAIVAMLAQKPTRKQAVIGSHTPTEGK